MLFPAVSSHLMNIIIEISSEYKKNKAEPKIICLMPKALWGIYSDACVLKKNIPLSIRNG